MKDSIHERCFRVFGIFIIGRSGVCLSPVVWVVDGVRLDVELFAELFHQNLHPFDLTIGWKGGLAVSDDADAKGPTAAVPSLAGDGRPLFLPNFRCLDFTIAAAAAVAQTKMAIEIVGIRQSVERGQLLYVAAFGVTVVNFDAVPSVRRLRGSRGDGVLDRIETLIGPKRKRAGGWRIVA